MATIPSLRPQRRPRIEIIPLIDIMFFLLATFMMVSLSMIQNQGLPLNLPAAATSTPANPDPQALTLSVRADGSIFYNGQPVNQSDLTERLRQLHAATPDARVIVQGDRDCPFGKVIELFDQIRRLGFTRLTIQTQRPAAS